MRKILLSLLLFCSQMGAAMAWTVDNFPTAFAIKEQKCIADSCFDYLANGQKIGTLRRAPGTSGSFALFDQANHRQITLKFVRFSWKGLNFDIYDKDRVLIAKAQLFFERKSGRLMRFALLNVDEHTVMATGVSNPLGTTHTIYRGESWDVLATMTRPMFTWSRDSAVTIQDRAQFSGINPNALAALMALYCIHDSKLQVDAGEEAAPVLLFQDLQAKLKKMAGERVADLAGEVVTPAQMQAAADLLNQRYREIYSDDEDLSEEEKIKQFVAFGCGLIQSRTLSPIEEQAMLQFLINRLES